MDQSKYKKELELLESESTTIQEKQEAIHILLDQGGSVEFQLVAEYILSYEPDTRWGIENPLEQFISLLHKKAIEELDKPGINENQNLLEALQVIDHFRVYNVEESTLLSFIKKYKNENELKYYSVKCLCNILEKFENPIYNDEVYSLFKEEVELAIKGEKAPCIKLIIELFVYKNNEQGLTWLLQLGNSDQVEFDVKYYLFFNVYGRSSSSELLKKNLKEQCQEFIKQSWLNHSEEANLISTIEHFLSQYK